MSALLTPEEYAELKKRLDDPNLHFHLGIAQELLGHIEAIIEDTIALRKRFAPINEGRTLAQHIIVLWEFAQAEIGSIRIAEQALETVKCKLATAEKEREELRAVLLPTVSRFKRLKQVGEQLAAALARLRSGHAERAAWREATKE